MASIVLCFVLQSGSDTDVFQAATKSATKDFNDTETKVAKQDGNGYGDKTTIFSIHSVRE